MPGFNYRKLLRKPNLSRRDVVMLATSLLVSFLIWFGFSLGQMTDAVVTVPVQVRSNIAGRSAESVGYTNITATVRVSGYSMLWHRVSRSAKPRTIDVDASAFRREGADTFVVSAESLVSSAPAIFGANATLEAFGASEYQFRFVSESFRKVPVVAESEIRCDDQYMPLSDLAVFPDSVLVYGEPSRLASVGEIHTKTISLEGVNSSLHGKVALDAPYGVRLSDREVGYDMDVIRYVEINRTVTIQVRHLPAGKTLEVYPSSAEVFIRSAFPPVRNPFEGASFYVDYNEFRGSVSGQCIVHCKTTDNDVLSCRVYPEVVECFEK